jgi:hypothetical protein
MPLAVDELLNRRRAPLAVRPAARVPTHAAAIMVPTTNTSHSRFAAPESAFSDDWSPHVTPNRTVAPPTSAAAPTAMATTANATDPAANTLRAIAQSGGPLLQSRHIDPYTHPRMRTAVAMPAAWVLVQGTAWTNCSTAGPTARIRASSTTTIQRRRVPGRKTQRISLCRSGVAGCTASLATSRAVGFRHAADGSALAKRTDIRRASFHGGILGHGRSPEAWS